MNVFKCNFNRSLHRIVVYPSHRDFRYSQEVEHNIRYNALNAQLVNDGYGVTNVYDASPFPNEFSNPVAQPRAITALQRWSWW
ncbi:DUF1329 domain-containing protein [Pseudomonas guariconensis]|uniref:DUF1329 domain-containing protein n=1 Tax=Pseudomonas guariconensis TaxID=1288410 RepID=UPI0018A9F5EA|nr:DUF1329 domain-containing protein [Pseudomonas guariconensis]MBF8753633.1 DUF1329 domain-containing protein [Pseudomonas guariconensis]